MRISWVIALIMFGVAIGITFAVWFVRSAIRDAIGRGLGW